ncbi:MAG: type IV pilus modification protein PilV [Gammaproteobacteria bacterium]|nr:type IV pilus modification protein PilV [Gammaproteobacteria bacterium]
MIHTQKGAGLIEVLIAVIIIAIGLLGIAGLQTFALKSATQAGFRSNATDLAASLADRIRGNQGAYGVYGNYTSNKSAQSSNNGNNAQNSNGNNGQTNGNNKYGDKHVNKCSMTPDETDQNRLDSDCGPDKIASEDLNEIVYGVNKLLPAGNLEVKCDNYTAGSGCPDNSVFHITISWKGQFASDAANQATRDAEELNEIVMSFHPGTL